MLVGEFAFIDRSAMFKEIHDLAILNPALGMVEVTLLVRKARRSL